MNIASCIKSFLGHFNCIRYKVGKYETPIYMGWHVKLAGKWKKCVIEKNVTIRSNNILLCLDANSRIYLGEGLVFVSFIKVFHLYKHK